jgi:hypothetical protein
MEITGYDLVVFTFEPPRQVFTRILASVLVRWPGALVQNLDGGAEAPVTPGASLTPQQLPAGAGVLLFLRDEAMNRHMEAHTYVPMADGEGPFAVWARVRREVELACSSVDELQVRDEPPRGGRSPEPYPAWLCSPIVYEITAVTPGDPDEHPFSAWVLGVFKRACSGLAEPLTDVH